MATYTIEQARAYYNTLPPEEKVKVDGIGGPSVEWLTNAVNAGVPDAIAAVGGKKGAAEGGWEEEGGYTLPWEDVAEPEEWLGKRPPTPSELRKYARRAGWSEDFERYTDRQLAAWLKDWDVGANKFRNPGGDLVEKPSEAGSSWSPGGGGGGGGGGPAFPGGGGATAIAAGGPRRGNVPAPPELQQRGS